MRNPPIGIRDIQLATLAEELEGVFNIKIHTTEGITLILRFEDKSIAEEKFKEIKDRIDSNVKIPCNTN